MPEVSYGYSSDPDLPPVELPSLDDIKQGRAPLRIQMGSPAPEQPQAPVPLPPERPRSITLTPVDHQPDFVDQPPQQPQLPPPQRYADQPPPPAPPQPQPYRPVKFEPPQAPPEPPASTTTSELYERTLKPLGEAPQRALTWSMEELPKAIDAAYDNLVASGGQVQQGYGQILSNQPASGLGNVAMGVMGAAISPFTAFRHAAGDATMDLPGSPCFQVSVFFSFARSSSIIFFQAAASPSARASGWATSSGSILASAPSPRSAK